MATWEDVGVNNYRDAVALFETKKYRSSTSRFYYAIFALMTHELLQRGAAGDFAQGRATPGHGQLPRLVRDHLTQFSEERLRNMARRISSLYRNRVEADYSLLRAWTGFPRRSRTAWPNLCSVTWESNYERKGNPRPDRARSQRKTAI